MAVTKDSWAREWLLRYVSMRHDTHQIDELIHIAQKAGYLTKNCSATKSGRHFIKISQEIDSEVRRSKQVIFFTLRHPRQHHHKHCND